MESPDIEVPKWMLENSERLRNYLEGKTIRTTIHVYGKLVNYVVE